MSRSVTPWALAQISDFHIVEPGKLVGDLVDTAQYLRSAVAFLNALTTRPIGVLASGDLVNGGRVEEYRHLRELLLPLELPLWLMVGNHDDRDAIRSVFPDHPELGTQGQIDYVLPGDADAEQTSPAVVVLDSVIAGAPAGRLMRAQLSWLEDQLAQLSPRPTIVALHHPPFATGIGHMDGIGLDAGSVEGLRDVLARHHHVQRLTCGHLHRSIVTRFAGTVAATVPSTAHAVAFDLEPGARGTLTFEPPAVTMHVATAGGIVTHTLPIGIHPQHDF